MAKVGKRLKSAYSKVNNATKYSLDEGFKLLSEVPSAKFDESVDVAVRLGLDAKKSDQKIRGAIALPHGLGKDVKVLVFAKGPKENEAKEAGADFVGGDEFVEKIKGGWLGFDKVIATPDMMATVSKVAKVLGPRGLMPNPKVGTVTMNVKDAVGSEKKGKLAYNLEKAGIVHASIGKKSMGPEKLKGNMLALLSALQKAKPASAKGVYMKTISLSSTMGPGLNIDVSMAQNELKK